MGYGFDDISQVSLMRNIDLIHEFGISLWDRVSHVKKKTYSAHEVGNPGPEAQLGEKCPQTLTNWPRKSPESKRSTNGRATLHDRICVERARQQRAGRGLLRSVPRVPSGPSGSRVDVVGGARAGQDAADVQLPRLVAGVPLPRGRHNLQAISRNEPHGLGLFWCMPKHTVGRLPQRKRQCCQVTQRGPASRTVPNERIPLLAGAAGPAPRARLVVHAVLRMVVAGMSDARPAVPWGSLVWKVKHSKSNAP